jgi:hypothetical protein
LTKRQGEDDATPGQQHSHLQRLSTQAYFVALRRKYHAKSCMYFNKKLLAYPEDTRGGRCSSAYIALLSAGCRLLQAHQAEHSNEMHDKTKSRTLDSAPA